MSTSLFQNAKKNPVSTIVLLLFFGYVAYSIIDDIQIMRQATTEYDYCEALCDLVEFLGKTITWCVYFVVCYLTYIHKQYTRWILWLYYLTVVVFIIYFISAGITYRYVFDHIGIEHLESLKSMTHRFKILQYKFHNYIAMKKKLNIFCVLMLLLMATQVVMTFVTGADAFMEGWEKGRQAEAAQTWSAILGFFVEMFAVVAALVSFISFIRFILNVNHNKVFVWENVKLLRLTACGLMILAVVAAGDELYSGCSFTEVYNHFFDAFLFGAFNLIISEVFAIGLKLQEEQDLTI